MEAAVGKYDSGGARRFLWDITSYQSPQIELLTF